jgi:hypothetical protein
MRKMKTTLITTVAATALAGFTVIAAAQTPQTPSGGGGMTKPESGQTEQKSAPSSGAVQYQHQQGGAQLHQQSGAQLNEKATSPNKSAQGTQPGAQPSAKPGAKPGDDEKMGQSQKNEASPQRGAQEESGERGVQTGPGNTGAQTGTKSQLNAQGGVQGGSKSRGASVQLSSDQRSRIGGIIGKKSSTRVSTNEHFDVSVGATVPRSVHFEVLPQDVVEIVPQYEGYDYVVVGEQILIIDPDSLEIVAVIET